MMVIMMLLRVMLMLTMNTVVLHVVTAISTAHNALLLKALCFCEPGKNGIEIVMDQEKNKNVCTWWGCKLQIWLCRQRPGRWKLSPLSKDPCNPPESWQSPQNEDKYLVGNKVEMHEKMCTQNWKSRLLTVLLSGGSKVESCHTVKL